MTLVLTIKFRHARKRAWLATSHVTEAKLLCWEVLTDKHKPIYLTVTLIVK